MGRAGTGPWGPPRATWELQSITILYMHRLNAINDYLKVKDKEQSEAKRKQAKGKSHKLNMIYES